jgi:hypothetical protein
MCSVYDFVTGERYSDQYGESGGKCPTSEAGQLEKTDIHAETWTYSASENTNENIAENIKEVEMVITPQGEGKTVTLPVEFDASTQKIKVGGALPAGDYDYEIKFNLKDGQAVSSKENSGHFTIRPCSQPAFDCAKISSKIILDQTYSGQGVCRGINPDRFYLDQFSCVKEDYNKQYEDVEDYSEQLADVNINVRYAGFCRYSLLEEAREEFDSAIKHQNYREAGIEWGYDPVAEKINIEDEAVLFFMTDKMYGMTHRGLVIARVGQCHIWAEGYADLDDIIYRKFHEPMPEEYLNQGLSEINRHPDFDHGKQRLRDLLIGFAQEVNNNIKEQCGD